MVFQAGKSNKTSWPTTMAMPQWSNCTGTLNFADVDDENPNFKYLIGHQTKKLSAIYSQKVLMFRNNQALICHVVGLVVQRNCKFGVLDDFH